MHLNDKRNRAWLGIATVAASLWFASAAFAVNGPGALYVAGATHTPTHWNIPVGVATNAEIRGVGAEAGSPLPATITVIVKSTNIGNTTLTATRIGLTNNYAFSYTPPSITNGDDFDACGTTVVAYVTNGQNSSNDLIDDNLLNGSGTSAAGFRFVDGTGNPIDCIVLGTSPATWGTVKKLFD